MLIRCSTGNRFSRDDDDDDDSRSSCHSTRDGASGRDGKLPPLQDFNGKSGLGENPHEIQDFPVDSRRKNGTAPSGKSGRSETVNSGSATGSSPGSLDSLAADTEAFSYEQQSDGASTSTADKIASAESYYGIEIANEDMLYRLRSNEKMHGEQVHDWAGEGMPTKIMGRDRKMEAFRERQDERPPEVPTDIEQRNERSVFRSKDAAQETGPAGQTGVPESVRDVISSSGQPLDADIQRAMEDRMGDSFGDVQIHTGPQAANACESINARAFTVGNHIAFNRGEYDPSSADGQRVIAHELAHVRQQTGGRLSMLPKEELALEIDPDPELEREAEEMAQRVMAGGELGIQRMENTDVHVQRERLTQMKDKAVGKAKGAAATVKDGVTAAKDKVVAADPTKNVDTGPDAWDQQGMGDMEAADGESFQSIADDETTVHDLAVTGSDEMETLASAVSSLQEQIRGLASAAEKEGIINDAANVTGRRAAAQAAHTEKAAKSAGKGAKALTEKTTKSKTAGKVADTLVAAVVNQGLKYVVRNSYDKYEEGLDMIYETIGQKRGSETDGKDTKF